MVNIYEDSTFSPHGNSVLTDACGVDEEGKLHWLSGFNKVYINPDDCSHPQVIFWGHGSRQKLDPGNSEVETKRR